METTSKVVESKGAQIIVSISASFAVAAETATLMFLPCCIAVLLDIITAHFLGRRVKRKHPKHSDGKFKSKYIKPIMITLGVAYLALILAALIDEMILRDVGQDYAVRFTLGVFLFYELWSVLENWSSENDATIARALQRIMVNKAERHLNVPLSDIMFNDKEKSNDSEIQHESDRSGQIGSDSTQQGHSDKSGECVK